MIKPYLQFIIVQSFEIWLWWQALILLFGTSKSAYTGEELFWYYIVSFFVTILAIAIIYFSHSYQGIQVAWPLLLILGLTIIMSGTFLWNSLLYSILPALPLTLIGGLFVYKLSIFMVMRLTSKQHKEVQGIAAHLLWQLGAIFIASWALIMLSHIYPGLPMKAFFIVLVVPIAVLFDLLLTFQEQRGRIRY